LLKREGILGRLLDLSEAVEMKDLEKIDELIDELNLNLEDILNALINDVIFS